ncbi:MAG: hypothetical protein EOO04_37850 [Chitinophagaceae bacterium]|nr:MAG: hypothetical protein EOO04_37850 [Chitinophagaceae bacterium]
MSPYSKLFAFVIVIACSFIFMAQKPIDDQDMFQRKQLTKCENRFVNDDDSLTLLLYRMSKKHQYQSVIDVCKDMLTLDSTKRVYHAFMAASFYNSNQKDSATFYTLHYLNSLPGSSISMSDVLMFNKYPVFLPILNDTVLHNKMLGVYMSWYTKNKYPRTDLGTELIRLAYMDQRIQYLRLFEVAWSKNQAEVNAANERFRIAQNLNNKQFINLYEHHPEFINKGETGSEDISNHQFILITHTYDSLTRYGKLLPMLKRAMDRKEVTPDSYVDEYVHQLLRDGDGTEAKRVTDSLCRLYHCRNVIKWE